MTVNYTDWQKNDFINFLLVHVANSDFNINDEEMDLLSSTMAMEEFKTLSKLHKSNSDIENIQIIQDFGEKFCCSQEDKDMIMARVREMVMVDDEFNIHEKTVLNALDMLLGNGVK